MELKIVSRELCHNQITHLVGDNEVAGPQTCWGRHPYGRIAVLAPKMKAILTIRILKA